MSKVRADKEREAGDGHDGTWVAHPGLVPIAMEIFDRLMPQPNQIERQRPDVATTAAALIAVPEGSITEAGLRQNISVGIGYLEAWLRGLGCVPLHNLMEDAATAEICRTQIWQWLRHGATLDDGRKIDAGLFHRLLTEEMEKTRDAVGAAAFEAGRYADAAKLFQRLIEADACAEFLTLPAYDRLVSEGH